jgi:hypothetical protein
VNAQSWRTAALVVIGALMLILTAIGIELQRADAHDRFVMLELAQGAAYLAAVVVTWRIAASRRALIAILAFAAVMRVGVLISPPYLSDDINRYVWDGRVEAAGINPYRYIPVDPHLEALRDETIFPNINRSNYAPTIYPPVAEYIFFISTRLGESVIAVKAMMVGFEIAAALLLLRLLARLGLPRERIIVYAWHPLVLWEFAGSGHIDAAVVFFLALALWARQRRAVWLAGSAVAAAALVKFFPAVVLPALYRRWDWKMPIAVATTAVVAYLPFLGARDAVFGFLPMYLKEENLASGSGFFLWNIVSRVAPPLLAFGALPYLVIASGAMASLALYVVLRNKTAGSWIVWVTVFAVVAMVFISPHYAWYFAWLVPLLCLEPRPSVLYLTVACPLLYFVPGGSDPTGIRIGYEAAIYGPFAVLACLELGRGLVARSGAAWIGARA